MRDKGPVYMPRCGEANPQTGDRCTRGIGHLGDHVATVGPDADADIGRAPALSRWHNAMDDVPRATLNEPNEHTE